MMSFNFKGSLASVALAAGLALPQVAVAGLPPIPPMPNALPHVGVSEASRLVWNDVSSMRKIEVAPDVNFDAAALRLPPAIQYANNTVFWGNQAQMWSDILADDVTYMASQFRPNLPPGAPQSPQFNAAFDKVHFDLVNMFNTVTTYQITVSNMYNRPVDPARMAMNAVPRSEAMARLARIEHYKWTAIQSFTNLLAARTYRVYPGPQVFPIPGGGIGGFCFPTIIEQYNVAPIANWGGEMAIPALPYVPFTANGGGVVYQSNVTPVMPQSMQPNGYAAPAGVGGTIPAISNNGINIQMQQQQMNGGQQQQFQQQQQQQQIQNGGYDANGGGYPTDNGAGGNYSGNNVDYSRAGGNNRVQQNVAPANSTPVTPTQSLSQQYGL